MTSSPTLRDALARFRETNGLDANEAARSTWTCRIGSVTLVLPNFAWRRKAIDAHDLHHVLTGYPCTMRGEIQMAAWEFGAGCMPHWAAKLFCLPLLLAGLIGAPRRTFGAFLFGRRSRSLHSSKRIEQLLAAPLSLARDKLTAVRTHDRRCADLGRFASLVLQAAAIALAPVLFLIGAWIVLYAIGL